MKSKLFVAIATVGLILGNANVTIANPSPSIIAQKQQNIVKFKDKILESAIRKQLGIGEKVPLTMDKLGKITELKIENYYNTPDNKKIKSLKGIEKLKNLTTLYLGYNQITDIKPLSSLSNLTTLDLVSNKITDIKPLSSLFNLTSLYLYRNGITDIKPLSRLFNLTSLDLEINQITDIKPLSSLSNLTYLDLFGNQITDIKPLSSLSNLIELHLIGNQITDIKPLSSLSNLTILCVDDTITNYEVLPEKLRKKSRDYCANSYSYFLKSREFDSFASMYHLSDG